MTDFTDKLDALELTLCNQYGSPSVYKQARAAVVALYERQKTKYAKLLAEAQDTQSRFTAFVERANDDRAQADSRIDVVRARAEAELPDAQRWRLLMSHLRSILIDESEDGSKLVVIRATNPKTAVFLKDDLEPIVRRFEDALKEA